MRHEHRCQVPFGEDSLEVSALDGAGQEENVLGGMPPEVQTLLSLCCLHLRTDGCGGDGYPEKDSHLTRNKVAATLLTDVRILQE